MEDPLLEPGIDIWHETVRMRWNRFGRMFGATSADNACRACVASATGAGTWMMFVKLNGEMIYLWRAVDHEGEILESFFTRTREESGAYLHEEGAEAPWLT